jgi:hypothetical protein
MMIVCEKYNDCRSGTYIASCAKSIKIKWDVNRSPLLFVRSVARVKSIRIEQNIEQESLAFCMWCCMCKKYKDRMRHRTGAPYFLYAAMGV